MSANQHQPDLLRSSYDIDAVRVELLWDAQKTRFTVATRWQNLAHFPVAFSLQRVKRRALAQASAVFEATCLNGATKAVARIAKKQARSTNPSLCVGPADYEHEVIRKTGLTLESGSA